MLIVMLSATEARIVREGRIRDPKWKPFPGSEMDLAETDDEMAVTRTRQRKSSYLDINARSQDWRGKRKRQGLLVATISGNQYFIGAAGCTMRSGDGYIGLAQVRIEPWRMFAAPVPAGSVLDVLDPATRASLRRILEEQETRELPKTTGERSVEALHALAPDFDAVLEAVAVVSEIPTTRRWEPEDLPELDASQTALRLFSSGWNALSPSEEEPELSQFAVAIGEAFRATENDYITDEATTFLDWAQRPGAEHGWFEFRDEGRRLLVKNINVSPAESVTGADLVYVRRDPDAVVLVQYKLLEQGKVKMEPFFRDAGGRLASQVRRMLGFANAADPRSADEAEYRLSRDIGFVKFIVPTAPRIASAGELRPDGRYHPAGSVDRLLRMPDRGPGLHPGRSEVRSSSP